MYSCVYFLKQGNWIITIVFVLIVCDLIMIALTKNTGREGRNEGENEVYRDHLVNEFSVCSLIILLK